MGLGLAALLVWLPLPFASITPNAATAARVGAFALLGLAFLQHRATLPLAAVRWPAAALVALALLGLLQSLPLPRGLVGVLSAGPARVAAENDAALGDEPRGPLTVSLAPAASRETAWHLLALAALLLVAASVGEDRRTRRLLLAALLAAASFQVLYGARQWMVGAEEIWGLPVPRDVNRLHGTYVNPNHLAFLLEIALCLTFAWTYRVHRRLRKEPNLEFRIMRLATPFMLWILLFLGLVLTGSRAGLAAGIGATVVQGLLLGRRSRRRSWVKLAGVAAVAAALGLATYAGFERGVDRFLGTSLYEVRTSDRIAGTLAALELWERYPMLGTGLGSFMTVFPEIQPDGQELRWRHLHNDWVELLLTGGLAGLAILAIGLFALLRRLIYVLRAGHRGEDRSAALAALGALAAVAAHSIFDFGLTMPANAFCLAAVVGAAAAAPAGGSARAAAALPVAPAA